MKKLTQVGIFLLSLVFCSQHASAQSSQSQDEAFTSLDQVQTALASSAPGCDTQVQDIVRNLKQYFSAAQIRQACPASESIQTDLDQINHSLHQSVISAKGTDCGQATVAAYVAGSVFLDYHVNKPALRQVVLELIRDFSKIQPITQSARANAGDMANAKVRTGSFAVKAWYERATGAYWVDVSERPFDTGRALEYLIRQIYEPSQNSQASADASHLYYVQPPTPVVSKQSTTSSKAQTVNCP